MASTSEARVSRSSSIQPQPTLRVAENIPRSVALAFLKGEPRENVLLISRILKSGMDSPRDPNHGIFLGVFDEHQSLRGLCFLGNSGTLVVSVDDPHVADLFGTVVAERGRRFSLAVGQDDALRAFLHTYLKGGGTKPVLDRRQPFYALDARSIVRGLKEIDMEQASLDSIDELTVLACDMVCEDLKLKPTEVDRRKYRLRMTERIVDGRAYMCRDAGGRVLFKCDLAVMGPEGALLEGVFTPKALRKQGIATRALWTLCRDLLNVNKVPFVVLHVDERNKAARAVYEKVGFKHVTDFRLVLMPSA
ncbi:MAG: GNAT family N-acetyltransferase [Planctomycetota bacterium]